MSRAKNEEESEHIKEVLKLLGARIRSLREAKGERNYEKFAFKHDLNHTQLWRYENGEDLYFSSLLKVLSALDISLAEFFSDGFDQSVK
ncbi:helix-turn-helix transcriptional regulator [Pedobacter riviphilus]|uniref:Helix-turn-helix transcriptional regulator n=1 Tax=Pedobacter riviphilus TaxID=2766984 RepID=A0ABX6TBM7_9SPHI|nr:helix-turn-helix transcriptional regulator [Pedobacter riviphilus]QNR82894.1 helix-turn-helix transcriptional regulator [Pedobacter riviphilus]